MPLKLYNTLSRKIEIFKPLKKKGVGFYTCGPTVYDYAHIGNLRTFIFEDFLKRTLLYNKYKVKHVMNITDVGHLTSDADEGEDKMEKGAKRENKTAWEIADFYTKEFKNNLKELNILPPDKWCKATDHIKDQIKLIKKLEKKGYIYKTSDGIYFDTSKYDEYGKLTRLDKEGLKSGARVDMGEKKSPTDFALWKFSDQNQKRQMEWNSPWGKGFPGWHIECSAMSAKYLGQPFDIHCGGIDHISVHHTNEIAQSEAANDKPLAKYWLHGEFLVISGDKMAKSGENFLTLSSLKDKKISPLAYRYFLLQTHYRKQLTFSWESLQAAQNGLEHLYNSTSLLDNKQPGNEKIKQKFIKLINNDLYIPGALAFIWDNIKNKTLNQDTILEFDKILGLRIKENLNRKEQNLPADIQKIVIQRDQARQEKDWKQSDELRDKLVKMDYMVEDTKNGTRAYKKAN